MHYSISRIRYWLEIIALPAFVFLVIHLAGHGFMLLTEGKDHPGHEHAHEADHVSIGEVLFTPEVLIGIGALVLFVVDLASSGISKMGSVSTRSLSFGESAAACISDYSFLPAFLSRSGCASCAYKSSNGRRNLFNSRNGGFQCSFSAGCISRSNVVSVLGYANQKSFELFSHCNGVVYGLLFWGVYFLRSGSFRSGRNVLIQRFFTLNVCSQTAPTQEEMCWLLGSLGGFF
ncbi:hypothetical protein HC823_01845 [Candidatus Gracilibacteria bacterium]|nr:hypothetical protein [Candidatus Gracilibacteria bacterium]